MDSGREGGKEGKRERERRTRGFFFQGIEEFLRKGGKSWGDWEKQLAEEWLFSEMGPFMGLFMQ